MAPLNPSLFFFLCVRVCRVTALCLRTCVCPCRWSPALHINPPVRAVGLRFHRDAKSRTLCLLPFIFSSRALWVCQETKFIVEQHTVTPSLPPSVPPPGQGAATAAPSLPRLVRSSPCPCKPGSQRKISDASGLSQQSLSIQNRCCIKKNICLYHWSFSF